MGWNLDIFYSSKRQIAEPPTALLVSSRFSVVVVLSYIQPSIAASSHIRIRSLPNPTKLQCARSSCHLVLLRSMLSFTAFAVAATFSLIWFKESRPTTSILVIISRSVSYLACSNSFLAFSRSTSPQSCPDSLVHVNMREARIISRYSFRTSGRSDIVHSSSIPTYKYCTYQFLELVPAGIPRNKRGKLLHCRAHCAYSRFIF